MLLLKDGKLHADGPPEEALSPANLRSVFGVDAQWLGEEGARVLAVTR